jgi:hypothetical protein
VHDIQKIKQGNVLLQQDETFPLKRIMADFIVNDAMCTSNTQVIYNQANIKKCKYNVPLDSMHIFIIPTKISL